MTRDMQDDEAAGDGARSEEETAETAVTPFKPGPAEKSDKQPEKVTSSVTFTMSEGVRRTLRAIGFVLAVVLLSAATMFAISAIAPSVLPDGPQGKVGATGPQGETGPRGRRGRQGRTGRSGAAGAPGAPGAPGATRACSNDPDVPLPYC